MTSEPTLSRVKLTDMPVDLWDESRRWFEGLIREFDVIAAEIEDPFPRDLLTFVAATRREFGRFSASSTSHLEEALTTGRQTVDVDMDVPPDAADAARSLLEKVHAADRFCRDGELLTLALTEEMRLFVDWYLTEVADQIEGAAPTSWPPPRPKDGMSDGSE